jgi:hypothetical protein
MLKGADVSALENLSHKWSVHCPTQVTSPIPGQYDIIHFINMGQCECLNEVFIFFSFFGIFAIKI